MEFANGMKGLSTSKPGVCLGLELGLGLFVFPTEETEDIGWMQHSH